MVEENKKNISRKIRRSIKIIVEIIAIIFLISLIVKESTSMPLKNSDITLYEEGYIVIVQMLASEIDYLSMDSLQQQIDKFPNGKNEILFM